MILTVGNTKGGVGKTTIALQLALARALAGRDVLLIDADRQGSAQDAVSMRAEANRTPVLACVHFPDGKVLRAQAEHMARRYEDVIIDAGGRDSTALRAALLISDAVLVPFAPRSFDVWALAQMAELVGEARAVRDGLPAAFAVLSLADPGATPDNNDAAAAVADHPELILLKTPIRRRKAYANASAQGLAVAELTPRDGKACDEIAALVCNAYQPQNHCMATGDA
jgi:chromosome partitioning protein